MKKNFFTIQKCGSMGSMGSCATVINWTCVPIARVLRGLYSICEMVEIKRLRSVNYTNVNGSIKRVLNGRFGGK